jgi:transposase-like protein
MFKTIERPADCEIRSVMRFLNARNVKLADIHRQICEVYCEHVMSDGIVRKWVRKFSESRDNGHDEPRSGRPFVVSDDLLRAVEAKVSEDRRFTISSLSLHFQKISRIFLYEIVTEGLLHRRPLSARRGYRNWCPL